MFCVYFILLLTNIPVPSFSFISSSTEMNRVTGDYFETLLYKIFVSIDEHTSISEVLILIS